MKESLNDISLVHELNEYLYEVFPAYESVKREVLKTYIQKNMPEKAIPVNLALLSSSPTNTNDMISLASSYADKPTMG